MPNHITNRIRFAGTKNRVQELVEFVKGIDEESGKVIPFDFNKIIPMPKELMVESGSTGELGMFIKYKIATRGFYKIEEYDKAKKRFDSLSEKEQERALDLGTKYHDNFIKYGTTNWYEWSLMYWGTKWNAYGFDYFEQYPDEITFQTAWSSPLLLFTKLSTLFPDITIEITYADEDAGSNTGIIYLENGKPLEMNIPDSQSIEGYEIYFDLNPDARDNFRRNGDTYEYKKD